MPCEAIIRFAFHNVLRHKRRNHLESERIPSVIEHVIKKGRDNGGTVEVAQSDQARN